MNKKTGKHHHWWNNAVQQGVDTSSGQHGTTAYATGLGDDHPGKAGNQKGDSGI